MANLKQTYKDVIAPALMKEFGFKSVMQIPKLEKVVLNMGVGDAVADAKNLENAVAELEAISGQRPTITKAKKSISTYKVRQGQGIGCMVTLRGDKMWAFVETLFNIALPRVRDFRGINPHSFDARGNYNLGIKEQIIFPQIVYDQVKKIRGFDIAFVISSDDKKQSYALLKALGAPFMKFNNAKDAK